MVYVTPAIRWGIGIWSVVAVAAVAASVMLGARPLSTGLLLVICAVPLVVVLALTGFRAEPRTAAQVLHDRSGGPR
jgi:hypothetical protein